MLPTVSSAMKRLKEPPTGTAFDLKPSLDLFVPVINMPRDDFLLHTDAAFVFSKYQIQLKDVIFLSDINFDNLQK